MAEIKTTHYSLNFRQAEDLIRSGKAVEREDGTILFGNDDTLVLINGTHISFLSTKFKEHTKELPPTAKAFMEIFADQMKDKAAEVKELV